MRRCCARHRPAGYSMVDMLAGIVMLVAAIAMMRGLFSASAACYAGMAHTLNTLTELTP